jgi:hypothetical protein
MSFSRKVLVGDVGIEVLAKPEGWNPPVLNNYDDFNGGVEGALEAKLVSVESGEHHQPTFSGNVLSACYDPVEGIHAINYKMRRHLAFLAGTLSPNYRFVHGAGISSGGIGIVLIGTSGSGKSSVSSAFGRDDVLDDDLLLASGKSMRRVSNTGYRFNYGSGFANEGTEMLPDDTKEAAISAVYLLDPDMDMRIEEAARSISPEITYDPRLGESLYVHHASKGPHVFCAPVFRLGSSGLHANVYAHMSRSAELANIIRGHSY